ncbi:hypothetical protein AMAG_18406 [Allomyces macrogynus ATCC 38327]|uniref:DOMON domain-containing protein n=1 Tax=Allomyces macrogynus (strain ATCC 38327) TaxID=578462 RepID=A0A0L0SBB1_ALLM3|nr:hypothetical protein AMAG_18406 [Allomyces macrogynus ATCC 38327]|eukprot:KNE59680.1 hypothetical protein AMAG_18406 [Allomyces macrogynus ATCC 38327]
MARFLVALLALVLAAAGSLNAANVQLNTPPSGWKAGDTVTISWTFDPSASGPAAGTPGTLNLMRMAVFTLRLGRAMRVGMDSTYQADSSAGGGAPGSEVATFSPDQSSIGGAPASTTVLGSIRATTTAGGSSADKSTGRMPSAITKSNAASRTSAAATDPRPTATGTGFVNRTVATFQLLNAGVMLLWALYLIVQLLGIGSPFTRILLSNTFSGLCAARARRRVRWRPRR